MSRKKQKKQPVVPTQEESIFPLEGEGSLRVLPWLVPVWILLFLFCFFSFTLPNNPSISRVDLLQILPGVVLDNVLMIKGEDAVPSGFQYLPQRVGFFCVMFFVLASAWSFGYAIFRGLGINHSKAPRTDELERSVIAFGLGLSGLSLIVLGFGLAGFLFRGLFFAILLFFIGMEVFARVREWRSNTNSPISEVLPTFPIVPWKAGALFLASLFVLLMLFGSMLPSIDFDVKEYHLQGSKEFLQNGRITMLPHNMYTSFPFLTEMLTLLGMVLYGDWYWGALAGKAILMTFAPLTAVCLFCITRRYCNVTAGWFAAILYLSTPWTYRISIIAYTEGALCFYVIVALFALMLATELYRKGENFGRWFLITGLLAGSAIATKYPGLIFVAIPLCGFACAVPFIFRSPNESQNRMGSVLKIALLCSVGVLITFGPWLAKNFVETGNPVYPLMYSLFGGADWDSVLNAKFKAGHRPDGHTLSMFFQSVVDVTMKNDWQSPLLFCLAPLAIFAVKIRRVGMVAVYLL